LTGLAQCANPIAEQVKFDLLFRVVEELPFDGSAARQAAMTRAHLELQGLTIGPFDLLIAGHALAQGLNLVTHNVGEFRRVPRLTVENWLSP